MKKFDLSDAVFKQFSDFIYDKCGIFIPGHKKYLLENRLSRVIEDYNLNSYDEYLYMLRYAQNGAGMDRLYDAITTNETYFFREPQQFDVFIEDVVSRVMENKKTARDIRVWSAASSTGEEPYTIAMLMKEKRFNLRAEIVGSDISPSVVESAKRAVFSSYSVRNVPEFYMRKYFRQVGQNYIFDASMRDTVRFQVVNLLERGRMAMMSGFDVIFCRNVLIYFDDKSKQKAVSHLYDSLRPGGFLFVGLSESLHNVTRALMPVTVNKVVVYQKAI